MNTPQLSLSLQSAAHRRDIRKLWTSFGPSFLGLFHPAAKALKLRQLRAQQPDAFAQNHDAVAHQTTITHQRPLL
ncbi:hypothetical protein JQ581_23935 [Bradyrhizobium liaoningense]|uniref:hypothetical protein n=1 Tax=Bradyrhizobium liaoningense TaxID=43992 RepID=UPI001BA8EF10|nr:hypothetical protein [Bradyrhizobium liaoningense]MBR0739990.1 hypothetical protein [Bradyrhizobium liaoningense]